MDLKQLISAHRKLKNWDIFHPNSYHDFQTYRAMLEVLSFHAYRYLQANKKAQVVVLGHLVKVDHSKRRVTII